MRHAAVARVGRHEQLGLALGVVQRVVEPRDHACGVAKGGMCGDVLDALAIDVDRAPVAQRIQELLTRHRLGGADLADSLGLLGERHLILARWALRHPSSSLLRDPRRAAAGATYLIVFDYPQVVTDSDKR